MKPGLSSFLNLSRWLAALLVLAGHVRNLLFVDMNAVPHPGAGVKLLYFATGLGHQAVVVFFVISGLLVGGVTLQRWRERGVDLPPYWIARFSRIYTVLLPALLLGLALDAAGSRWFDASHLYATGLSGLHVESLVDGDARALGPAAFFGNLLSLQGIAVPTYGSNGPLWSLAYEWWYYVLFAFAAGAALLPRRRLLLAVAAALLAAVLPGRILLWGLLWLLGIPLYAWSRSEAWKPHWSIGAVLLVAALAWTRMLHPATLAGAFGADLVVALAFGVLVAGAARLRGPVPLSLLHAHAADVSYTVYLAHFPALLFAAAVGAQVFGLPLRAQPGTAALAHWAGMIGLLLVYCWLIASLTERRTQAVRRGVAALVIPLLRRASAGPTA